MTPLSSSPRRRNFLFAGRSILKVVTAPGVAAAALAGARRNLLAGDKRVRRIHNDPIAWLQPGDHFNFAAEVPSHRDASELYAVPIFHYGRL